MVDVSNAIRGKYVDVDRIQRTVSEGPYDAVVVVSPENVPYYSGFYNMDIRIILERIHIVVWPRDGDPAFIVTERRASTLIPGDTFIKDVVSYQGEGPDSMRALADVLTDRGVASGRIGFEGRNFPAGHYQELMRRLPDLRMEDAFSFLESVRLIKTPAEAELIEKLTAWTTAAIDTAFAEAKPGDTERSIAARMQYELLKNGADMINADVFGSGQRSGSFHPLPTDTPVENGTIITTDFGGLYDGYLSDVARTAVMGKASDKQRDTYARVSEAKHRIVDYIRPGMLASEVANFGRQAYADVGLEFKWAIIGHSIGMGIHESPQIYPWVDEPILPGMVMMIELGYHNYPDDSFHLEDIVVITDRGAEYRSDFSKHETIWELGL